MLCDAFLLKVCELPACDAAPAWVAEEWGPCSAQCGLGKRHREVTCRTAQGPVADHLCEARSKPSNQVSVCVREGWISPWIEDI